MKIIEIRTMETICRQLPRIADALEILSENQKPKHCCICGNEILGYPNNAYPFGKVDGDICCDRCNIEKVIPERIRLMQGEK